MSGRRIDTEQFRALCAEFLPPQIADDPKLENFFDQWVYGTGMPDSKLHYSVKGKPGALKLTGTVTQSDVKDDFSAMVPVEIQTGRGKLCGKFARRRIRWLSRFRSLCRTPKRCWIPVRTYCDGRIVVSLQSESHMQSELVCFNSACRARFDINDVLYNCPKCGGLLEAQYDFTGFDAAALKTHLGASGGCRTSRWNRAASGAIASCFRFSTTYAHVVTLREGQHAAARRAARRGVRRSGAHHVQTSGL